MYTWSKDEVSIFFKHVVGIDPPKYRLSGKVLSECSADTLRTAGFSKKIMDKTIESVKEWKDKYEKDFQTKN